MRQAWLTLPSSELVGTGRLYGRVLQKLTCLPCTAVIALCSPRPIFVPGRWVMEDQNFVVVESVNLMSGYLVQEGGGIRNRVRELKGH